MNNVYYDNQSDTLWFVIKEGAEDEYREVAPGINVELGKEGELMGIEVLNASKVLKPLFNKEIVTT